MGVFMAPNLPPTTSENKHVTREAKAAASHTNRGAVERMDALDAKRPAPNATSHLNLYNGVCAHGV